MDGIKPRMATAKQVSQERGRTTWDAFMYNLGLYIDDSEAASAINDLSDAVRVQNPYELIEDSVSQNRFRRFWGTLLETSEPLMLDAMKKAAEERFSTTLPHPRKLLRPLVWPAT
jgi:hypothetical protein